MLFFAEALEPACGAGVLRCGIWGCGAEMEGFVEDFIGEDRGGG